LLVHDEPELTDAVRQALSELGIDVDVAIDAGDAVKRLISHRPDLVCVNLNLPRDSGYDVCELIRGDQSLRGLPIVVMSDRCSPEDIAYAEEAGANVFLRLPSPSKALTELAESLDMLLNEAPPSSGGNVTPLSAGPRSVAPPSGVASAAGR
jgi:DNA-binding response OmpR family regulator